MGLPSELLDFGRRCDLVGNDFPPGPDDSGCVDLSGAVEMYCRAGRNKVVSASKRKDEE